jgi:hypothetical protein
MDPTVADVLKNAQGFQTKRSLVQWLSQNVEKTVSSYWGNAVVASISEALALQGLEPFRTWKQLPADAVIKPFNNPQGPGCGRGRKVAKHMVCDGFQDG